MAKSDDYREVFYTPKEKSKRQGFVRKGEKRDPNRPAPRPGEGSMRLSGEPEPQPRLQPTQAPAAPQINPIERIKAILDEHRQMFTAKEIAESMARTDSRRGFGGRDGAPLFSPVEEGVAPTGPNPQRVATPYSGGALREAGEFGAASGGFRPWPQDSRPAPIGGIGVGLPFGELPPRPPAPNPWEGRAIPPTKMGPWIDDATRAEAARELEAEREAVRRGGLAAGLPFGELPRAPTPSGPGGLRGRPTTNRIRLMIQDREAAKGRPLTPAEIREMINHERAALDMEDDKAAKMERLVGGGW